MRTFPPNLLHNMPFFFKDCTAPCLSTIRHIALAFLVVNCEETRLVLTRAALIAPCWCAVGSQWTVASHWKLNL